jgi:hypothetical protein
MFSKASKLIGCVTTQWDTPNRADQATDQATNQPVDDTSIRAHLIEMVKLLGKVPPRTVERAWSCWSL